MTKEKKYPKAIYSWPEDERPRERLIKFGADKLSDTELLAILLRVGSSGQSAVDMARELIKKFGSFRNIDTKSVAELKKIKGLGTAKIAQIKAAIEIGKRFLKEKNLTKIKIKTSRDIVDYFMPYMRDAKKEIFKVILLDGKNKIIKDVTISEGTLNKGIVHPREVIKEAISESASALILLHNHPSGEPEPSQDDIEITNRLISACELVGIRVLDHVILGDNKYYSFYNEGLIKEG
ncbi:MAG: DNA repair protein RadC [Candidatus Marinimicrobia bacterium]|nr:DNA repair protein RadC [Candidatus Neomarinimicrobiota bacterium]